MAQRKDFVIEAGSTERWVFIWRQPPLPDAPEGTLGAPHDLNSATARMQIRTKPYRTGTLLWELTEHTDSGVLLGGETGAVAIYLKADLTGQFKVRRAFYDLFITLATGEVHKVLTGRIKIDQNVTAPSTGIGLAPEGLVSPDFVRWTT